jgi:translation initiation factor eIF-2B subunit delta
VPHSTRLDFRSCSRPPTPLNLEIVLSFLFASTTKMSSPQASSSKAKPAKAPRPTSSSSSSAPNTATSGAAAGVSNPPKAKSAKDLKKEKRAAAVAARGPGADDIPVSATGASTTASGEHVGNGGQGQGQGQGQASPIAGPSAIRPRPGLSNNPSASNLGGANASHANAAQAAGSSAVGPRRPPILASESTAAFLPAQQNLFFSHLPAHKAPSTAAAYRTNKLHPLVIRLGVLMSSGELRGANARTMGMMSCFQEVIRDYDSPEHALLWKDLPIYLSPMIAWLETCRPKGVGGGNAIRWVKEPVLNLMSVVDGARPDVQMAEERNQQIGRIRSRIRGRSEFLSWNRPLPSGF